MSITNLDLAIRARQQQMKMLKEMMMKMVLENHRIPIRQVAEENDISIGSFHGHFFYVLSLRRVSAKFVPKMLNLTKRTFP